LIPFIKKLFTNQTFVVILWFGLSLIAVTKEILIHQLNNYYLYKYSFYHLIHQQNIYIPYPELFFDHHHYGPFFGLLIAPFAVLPDYLGVFLWSCFNSFVLYKAIMMLPMKPSKQTAILLICAHELMTASFSVQVNPLTTALIILSYVYIKNGKDFWSALMIIAGIYIKLYGIVGLAFFFFSDNKLKFILSLIFWAVVLMGLTMLVSSPAFTIQSYHDWYKSLSEKVVENEGSFMQDISVRGMIRRIFHVQIPDLYVLIPGVLLFLSSYIRFKNWGNTQFQLLILASTLIFPVIFSNSSESPTYIIAFAGVAIWYMNAKRPVTGFDIFLLVFALIMTSLSPSDLFPHYLSSHYTKPYALKALPCFVIWLKIIYETWTRDFEPEQTLAAA